jgi:4-hydroxybenzoate polyprenyltransferase
MPLLSLLRTLLILGRISNLPTIWTNVAVGWFLSGGGWTAEAGWIVLGMSLVYVAGMTLNDAFDADWDREHATRRPIPSGRIGTGAVWMTGLAEMVAGVAVLAFCTSLHPLLLAGLVLAILLYNWLHKRWSGSVLIMGLCRALVYVGAGSAVAAHTRLIEVPATLLIVAGGVVLYIAGLTLAARTEHLESPGALRFLPRLLLMLPVVFGPLAARSAPDDLARVSLLVLGVLGTGAWLIIMRRALAERVPKGIAFAIAGIAFYDASVVAFADWRAAVACLACFVLTLALQRVVPAT